jgi:hypothetical protein
LGWIRHFTTITRWSIWCRRCHGCRLTHGEIYRVQVIIRLTVSSSINYLRWRRASRCKYGIYLLTGRFNEATYRNCTLLVRISTPRRSSSAICWSKIRTTVICHMLIVRSRPTLSLEGCVMLSRRSHRGTSTDIHCSE